MGSRDSSGNVTRADGLGCPARDFGSDPLFVSSYNTYGAGNQVEPSDAQMSFRTNPAYNWWGPGGVRGNEIRIIVGGHLADAGIAVYTGYSENVGFTDGSVRWFARAPRGPPGVVFNPLTD